MTAIDSMSSYSSHVVALQLLQGKAEGTSSNDDKPMYIRSDAALAGKAASSAVPQSSRQNREVLTFLCRTGFSTSSDEVLQSLRDVFADPALRKEFNAKIKEETVKARDVLHKRISRDGAQLLALRDVILAHRKMFPEEEFALSVTPTDYGEVPPEPVSIPSVSDMAAEIFKGEVAQKQEDYDAAVAAKDVKPDKDNAKLDAMEQAVSTLVMNGAAVVDQGAVDAQAAYTILAQKLYSDEAEDANGPPAEAATKPQQEASIGVSTSA